MKISRAEYIYIYTYSAVNDPLDKNKFIMNSISLKLVYCLVVTGVSKKNV